MLNFQRHCNSKLVVQEAELRCTPRGVQTTKVGVRCTPTPPVEPPMIVKREDDDGGDDDELY